MTDDRNDREHGPRFNAGRPDLGDDDQLLAQLSLALEEDDPVPSDAMAMASSIFELGDADAELAELVFDSLFDEALVVMRTDISAAPRALSFAAGRCRIDIELSADGSTLLGQLDPAERTEVELETPAFSRRVESDELGRFRFGIERGSLRLRVLTDTGVVVATPWIIW